MAFSTIASTAGHPACHLPSLSVFVSLIACHFRTHQADASDLHFWIMLAELTPPDCVRSLALTAELLQVKVQTTPGYAKGLTDGLPKFVQQNGVAG